MSTFEESKKEYLEKLSTNMDFVNHLIEQKNESSRKTAKLLLDPRNERELKVANGTLTQKEDMVALTEAALCGNVEEIPLEENKGISFLINIINALADQQNLAANANAPVDLKATLKQRLEPLNDPKEIARICYSLLSGLAAKPIETVEYIQGKVKIDFENEIETAKFKLYLQESQDIIQKAAPDPTANPSSDMTDEEVAAFDAYVNEFHALCEKGIQKGDEKGDPFVKLFMNLLSSLHDDDDDE